MENMSMEVLSKELGHWVSSFSCGCDSDIESVDFLDLSILRRLCREFLDATELYV